MEEKRPLLSIEGAISILVGLLAAAADMSWELRAILVAFAIGLAIHISRRFVPSNVAKRLGFAITGIVGLVLVTWRPIWEGFHKDFPSVTGETALSRIIIAAVVCAVGYSGYRLLIRPRGRGYRLIPAQLMAFGASVIGLGLFAVAIGLLWQFQQNRMMGITVENSPTLLPAPNNPQITQAPAPPALPPPTTAPSPEPVQQVNRQPAPQPTAEPQPQSPLMSGYALTPAGSRVLANEAFKIKDVLPNLTVFLQSNDNSGRPLATEIVRAFSIGGIPSTLNFGQLGGPTEKGVIILFDDPEKLPEAATQLKGALEKAGMRVTVIKRAVGTFQFYVGPDPNS
jgi:hypothetical protein